MPDCVWQKMPAEKRRLNAENREDWTGRCRGDKEDSNTRLMRTKRQRLHKAPKGNEVDIICGKKGRNRCSGKTMSPWSCHPVVINFLTYTGTLALFTAVFFIDMPYLPYPLQGCLLNSSQGSEPSKSVRYLALALWNIHFVRRSTEVLFVHIYKRRMPLVECIGAPVYYWVLALIIAWSINEDAFQSPPLVSTIIGAVIFLVGEAGNAVCHLKLRLFRTRQQDAQLISPDTGHIMPYGVFFDSISCPHYTFEITTWTGFFLVVWTLPAGLILVFTIITLAFYADKKHKAYVSEFDGEYNRPLYPESRKRLIPFLF